MSCSIRGTNRGTKGGNALKPLSFLNAFITLFLLCTFATSYRQSVQAAVPVLSPLLERSVLGLPPLKARTQPSTQKPAKRRPDGLQSLRRVISSLSPELRPRLREIFIHKGINYPPSSLTLIVLKEERRFEIWSPDTSGNEQLVITYPILGASGTLGPKLRRGDLQVPEGFYRVLWFNPNSEFYLSLKLDYPNKFDRRMAELDGRTELGGDIFIHGYDVSLGCLAIGNPAIEELFLMVYDAGRKNTRVIISPYDFRQKNAPASETFDAPLWTGLLYKELKKELFFYTKTAQEDNAG